jgi:hypothetical protein
MNVLSAKEKERTCSNIEFFLMEEQIFAVMQSMRRENKLIFSLFIKYLQATDLTWVGLPLSILTNQHTQSESYLNILAIIAGTSGS